MYSICIFCLFMVSFSKNVSCLCFPRWGKQNTTLKHQHFNLHILDNWWQCVPAHMIAVYHSSILEDPIFVFVFLFFFFSLGAHAVLLIKITMINWSELALENAIRWKTTSLLWLMGGFTHVILIKKNEYIWQLSISQKAKCKANASVVKVTEHMFLMRICDSRSLNCFEGFCSSQQLNLCLENVFQTVFLYNCQIKRVLC